MTDHNELQQQEQTFENIVKTKNEVDPLLRSSLGVVKSVSSARNDIKISAVDKGVAKLSFGYIEDMQGDSSLEPGEVKTPPPGCSPAGRKDSKPETATKLLAKEALAKAMKTVSQLEAEACEEKVRAILELDAKRHKEEQEKRKMEKEKRKQRGELDSEEEREKKTKSEHMKKIKKG